jgi:hypothetical protein
MRRASRAAVASWGAALLGGCALIAGPPGGPLFPAQPGLTAAQAAQRVIPGQSTRAQVADALGTAETIRFNSGWEVWVYRVRAARHPGAGAEFVVLFAPDGVVGKMRVRAADASPNP